ncbi:MAG: hypothetical protein AAF899_05370 [Pseudomonadota bacterium]
MQHGQIIPIPARDLFDAQESGGDDSGLWSALRSLVPTNPSLEDWLSRLMEPK